MFLNQVVHSFQTKLLRTEINKARTDEKNVEVKLERARGAVQRGVDWKLSVTFARKYISTENKARF